MGCKQTTTKPPPVVIATSPSTSNFVKSALKTSRVKGGKSEKLSNLKHKDSTVNKSVNFDEKVRVKLRTPTPREKQYERTPSNKAATRPKQRDDYDEIDDDDEVTSVSSQEENVVNERIKTATVIAPVSLQRSRTSSIWQKNNAIGVVPKTYFVKEKPPIVPTVMQQPSMNSNMNTEDNSNMPIGNVFRVRRKLPQPMQPETPNSIIPPPSPSISSSRSTIITSSQIVQRPLSDTNTALIEHHALYPNDNIPPQTTYFSYNRRPPKQKRLPET